MYKILLCLRYLRTRYIALACIISVTLGVATMIVVNSVMAGFSTEMRDRIRGLLADVIVETNSLDGVPDPEMQMARIRQVTGDKIEAITATVEVYGMLTFQYAGQYITRPVTLIGIKPEGKAKVGPLVDYLESYNQLKEAGALVRAPLRPRDVPPGWELTDEALAYRKQWMQRQEWLLQQFHHHKPDEDDGRQSPFEPGQPPPFGGETDENAESASKADSLAGTEPPPFGEGGKPAAADPFEKFDKLMNKKAQANPNDLFPEDVKDKPADPHAPLPGRLYVGLGLISFPYDEEGTGKVKTQMMVQPGDDVKISTVSAGRPPDARHFNATIVDVFKCGMSEYDSNLVFCNLEYLQEIRGMFTPETGVRSVTSFQIKLKNFDDAEEVVKNLQAAFPPGLFSVKTWEQKQGPLLSAVEVESAILNVLLFLIIAVAGFGILAIFFMIVVEKTRDIGILKSLGASSRGVMSIFLSYGLALGIVGSGVGVALGLAFVKNINTIEGWITWITGRKVFDEKIYYFPEIPTSINPMMVLWVALGAMTIAVLASVLPARRASRLHPVEALRYE
jgi:lipoprotein-releasing system permease protein